MFRRAVVLALIPVAALAQAPSPASPPFQATAELGRPATVGSRRYMDASRKQELEVGNLREVTLESAALGLVFATPGENIVATAGEKLLILRAQLRNPEKTSNFNVTGGSAIGFKLWQRYDGTGKFQFVGHFDPDSLRPVQKNLKGGESVRFVSVWRVPVDFVDFRLGLVSGNTTLVPWYDLNGKMTRLSSSFATADGLSAQPAIQVGTGQPFDMDGLELVVHGLSQPRRVGGSNVDPSKPAQVVALTVTNRQLQSPARWGWQFVSAELSDGSGPGVTHYPTLYNEATDAAWAGDLAPGASVRTQFVFHPAAGRFAAREFRLTFKESGRMVSVRLRD